MRINRPASPAVLVVLSALITALGLASSLTAGAHAAVTESFSTGASTFLVPSGVTSLQVHAVGGQGSRGYLNAPVGGRAAVIDGTLAATPGATLHLFTAGNGSQCGGGADGAGYNGGGRPSLLCVFSGGGGGASDIRTTSGDLSTRVLIAAGGGGAGDYGSGGDAGAPPPPSSQGCVPEPQPGTAVAGGAGGGACGANPVAGTAGSFGQGGDSGYRSDTRGNVENSGGGGGGGWYGGGGGSVYGGGAGGSSHTMAVVSGALTSLAARGSTPVITLTYTGLTLSVGTAGTGSGFVDAPGVLTSTPSALDCGRNTPGAQTDCAKEYRPGASVTLTAHPAADSEFTGFTGGCVAAGTTCTTTVDAAKTVTATFALRPSLTVIKAVTNDHGGTTGASGFTMNMTGSSVSDASFPGSATGTTVTLQSGAYSVAETLDPAYAVVYSSDCSGTIAVGQHLTCTVTNDDKPGTLKVITDVVNDDGGMEGPAAFTTHVAGTDISDDSFPGAAGAGTTVTLDAGAYEVTEAVDEGYAVTYSDGCTGAVGNGETKTCTITNDDVAPKLTVVKEVVNDDGGTKTAGDFTMTVSAVGIADGDKSFPGVSGAGRTLTVRAGAFSVDEVQMPGYAKTTAGNCSGTLALGETRTCTITGRDVAPRLNVVTVVVNDDGGTKQPADFTITATGTDISDGSFAGLAAPGTALTLDAGGYAVTATPPAGYVASLSPECASTIAVGEERTCTVTNDDATPPPRPVARPPVGAAEPARCVSSRVLRVSIKRHYRGTLRSTVVTLNGRRVATLRGRRTSALISLAGRTRSTVTVRLRMRTKADRRVVDTRRYRLCVPTSRRR